MDYALQHKNRVIQSFTLWYSIHFSSFVTIWMKIRSLLLQGKQINAGPDPLFEFLCCKLVWYLLIELGTEAEAQASVYRLLFCILITFPLIFRLLGVRNYSCVQIFVRNHR